MSGYIKMYRKLLDWQWFNVDYMVRVWIYILMKASYDGGYYGTVKVGKGQMVTGRKKMAAELNLSEQQIRTALDRLKATNEITIEATNKYSVITVVNWADYQCDCVQATNEAAKSALNEQPTNNQQITTIKESKEVKKVKKNIYRHHFGLYNHVLLSDEEYQKLVDEYGESLTNEFISRVDEGVEMKGYKYKNYYLAIKNWMRRDGAKKEDSLPKYNAENNPVFDEERFEELMRRRA